MLQQCLSWCTFELIQSVRQWTYKEREPPCSKKGNVFLKLLCNFYIKLSKYLVLVLGIGEYPTKVLALLLRKICIGTQLLYTITP